MRKRLLLWFDAERNAPLPLIAIVTSCMFFQILSCSPPVKEDHLDFLYGLFDVAESIEKTHGSKRAIAYFDSVFYTISDPGIGDMYKKYDFHRKLHFHADKDYIQAQKYIDSMFYLLKEHVDVPKYNSYYNTAHLFMGDVLLAEGKFTESFKYFYEGKRLSERQSDLQNLSEYSGRLGMVSYRQKKFLDAASYFKQSVSEYGQEDDTGYYFTRTQELLDNIGLSYMRAGKKDSALFYYNETLSFIEKNKYLLKESIDYSESARAVVLGNLGDYYADSKNFAKSKEMFSEGIEIFSRKGHDLREAQSQQAKLAELYLSYSKNIEARQVLSDLRTSLDKTANPSVEISWNKLQSRYLVAIGRKDLAFDYAQSHFALKDSSDKQSNLFAVSDIRRELEALKNKNELSRLAETDKIREIYLMMTIGVIVLLLIILYLIWHNYRKSKKNVAVLHGLNEEISTKHVEMMVAFESLEKSHQDNRQMMKVVAHDLRNPLLSIIRYLEDMNEQIVLTTEQQRVLSMVKTSGSDSLKLIDELLHDSTRVHESHFETVQLDSVLLNCVSLLAAKAKEKEQQIHVNVDPVSISVDREKIWRVMSNLIVNGIKFSPAGSNIFVTLKQTHDKVLTSVRDNGIGIPDSIKENIFDMFTSSQRIGTAGEESFGIGLAICKNIVEAHNGKIWFKSVEGHGSTFFVELPL